MPVQNTGRSGVKCLYDNPCNCIKPATDQAGVDARTRAVKVSEHFMNGGTMAEYRIDALRSLKTE